MEPLSSISKARTKKTKSREKKAVKTMAVNTLWKSRPSFGISVGILLWLFSMILIWIEHPQNQEVAIERVMNLVGNSIYLLFGLIASIYSLGLVKPNYLVGNSRVLLLVAIAFFSLIPIKLIYYFMCRIDLIEHHVVYLLSPFAMASLLGTILLSSVAGIIIGAWVTLVVVIFTDGDLFLLLAGLSATIVASITAQQVRTRAKVIRIGVSASISQICLIVGLMVIQWTSFSLSTVLLQAVACVFGGLLAAILTLFILPAFERMTGITTDITMLEFADLDHPLLQRLALEAPGTYHHSLVVANLAQAATEEIGENSLVARVCCYFHDIGKLIKPEFFTENIGYKINPHDGLPPTMSSLVITSHVKEGVSLAILHKLPRPVIDIIQEHHGTSLVSFFHDKARTQIEKERNRETPNLDEWNYRYPGPKPVSSISGIIALADSLEAASRTLEKATPGHIEGLVDEIVSERISDRQLENCNLTMQQLTRIKTAFVFSMTSILHGRTPYPKNENSNKQPPEPSETKSPEIAGADNSVHG